MGPSRRADVDDVRPRLVKEIIERLIRLRSSKSGERLCQPEDHIMNCNDFMSDTHALESLQVESRHPACSHDGHFQSFTARPREAHARSAVITQQKYRIIMS